MSGFSQGLENRENREKNNGQGKVREFYFGPKVREFCYFRSKVRVFFLNAAISIEYSLQFHAKYFVVWLVSRLWYAVVP